LGRLRDDKVMAGTRASWTPERRARQAEACRKQMADPARRERQAQIMRAVRLNPEHQAAWLEARRKPERRAVDSATMTRLHLDRDFEANRIAAQRAAVKGSKRSDPAADRLLLAERDKVRNGPVPEGYAETYDYLLRVVGVSPAMAKEIVHQQHSADTR
jgi:hypothetical protein